MASRTWASSAPLIDAVATPPRAQAPHRAPEARRAARLLRDHALPPRRCCSAISARRSTGRAATATTACEPAESFDGTELAQKALSARLPHRPALRRRPSRRRAARRRRPSSVAQLGHDRLSIFGVGRDLDRRRLALGAAPARRRWACSRSTSRATAACAWAPSAATCCAASARSCCAATPRRAKPRAHARRRARRRRTVARRRATSRSSRRCARWRLEGRARQDVPPYVIFHDATLAEMARGAAGARSTALAADPRRRRQPSSSATATRSSTWWRRRADG